MSHYTFDAGLLLTLTAQVGIVLTTFGLFRRTGDLRTDILWFLTLRWGVMSALTIAAGLCGVMTAPWLAILSVGLGLSVAIWKRQQLIESWTSIRTFLSERMSGFQSMDTDTRHAFYVGVFLFGLFVLRSIAAVWFYVPYSNDPTNYHLPKLAVWMQTGSIDRMPFDELRAYLPGGLQLIQMWWVVFLHHDLLIEMAGLEFLAFGGIAVYILSRDLGASRPQGGLAALLFTSLPVMMAQSTACMNDIAVGALTLAALRVSIFSPRWCAVSIAVAVVSVGMSIKPTMIYTAPVIGVLLLCRKEKSTPLEPWSLLRFVSLAIPVLAAAYWYLANALEFGNPIYPAGVEFAGWRPFNEAPGLMLVKDLHGAQQSGFSMSSLAMNFSEFFQYRIYDAFAPYSHDSVKQVGWGWCGMGLGLPILVYAARERLIPVRVLVAFGVSFVLTMGALKPDFWNMRFTAWCAALPCIAVALILPAVGPVARRGVLYLALLGTLLNLIGILSLDRLTPNSYRKIATSSWDRRSYSTFSPEAFFEKPLRDETVAFMGVAYPLYAIYGPDFTNRVVPVASSADVKVVMESCGARHLVLGDIVPPWDRAMIKLYVESGYLTKIDENWYMRNP